MTTAPIPTSGASRPGGPQTPPNPPSASPASTHGPGASGSAIPQKPNSVGSALLQIPVSVQVVLGSVRLPLSRVAELSPGATINLDQKLGEPASILVNGREIAKGNLFVSDGEDERLGITITELIPATPAGG